MPMDEVGVLSKMSASSMSIDSLHVMTYATPEVKGLSEALEAPGKAADCVGADVSSGGIVMLALRTFCGRCQPRFNLRIGDTHVNDMDNTACHKEVGHGDLGAVDKDVHLFSHGDCDVHSRHGGQIHAVHEHGAVANCAVDNVILQDHCQVIRAEVCSRSPNVLEGLVAGSKDGNVLQSVHGGNQVGPVQGPHESTETSLLCRARHVRGDGQNLVDDVDDTASKIGIGGGDGGIVVESRVENYILALHGGLNTLSSGDIGELFIHQHCWNEDWHLSDGRGGVRAIQDVVGEDGLNGVGIILSDCRAGIGLEEGGESLVGRCQNGDVGRVAESGQQVGE